MAEAALVVEENDPVLESEFMQEMAKQMRAIDTYDTMMAGATLEYWIRLL